MLPVLPAALGLLFLAPGLSQEVEWYHSGLYAGLQLGAMNANASGADLEADLAGRGHAASATIDDTDGGYKVYVGYRFESPWALELGYVDLGVVESTVIATPADPQAFLRDLADVHPFAGRGVTFAAEYFLVDRPRVDFGLRAGLWAWRSEVDIRTSGLRVDVSQSGLDPFAGGDVLIRLTRRLSLRAQYEKYWLDGDDVDFASVGLQVALYR